MHRYHVQFEDEGETVWEAIDAVDPGGAFARCQKLHPTAKMLQAQRQGVEGISFGAGGVTRYEAPRVQRAPKTEPRPPRPPRPTDRDGIMPFYDEVVREDYPPF